MIWITRGFGWPPSSGIETDICYACIRNALHHDMDKKTWMAAVNWDMDTLYA